MRSFEEVQKSLKPTENLLREHPETDPRAWMNLLKKEMDLGEKFFKNGELDEAYIRYFFVVQMTLEVLPNQKNFSAQDHQYQQLRSRMSVIMTRLEELKTKLKAQDRNGQSTNIGATANNNQNTSQAFNSAVSAKFPSLVSRNSTDAKSSKSASFPQLSGISAVEIQTLLANSSPRILFIDVRPLEEFIQGHIGWRSIQSPPAAGVINIEPDWLKEGVTDADINQYLTSFGSSSNTAKILFDARSQMDMIIFYDNDSRKAKPGGTFELLYHAIYDDILQAPKVMPKVLSGGFISWNYFVVNSKDLVNSDWAEIGEGNGIRKLTRSTSSSPQPSRIKDASPQATNTLYGTNQGNLNTGISSIANIQKSPSNPSMNQYQLQHNGNRASQEFSHTGKPSNFQRSTSGDVNMNNPLNNGLLQSNQMQNNYGLGLNTTGNYTNNTQSSMNNPIFHNSQMNHLTQFKTPQGYSQANYANIPPRTSSLGNSASGGKSLTRKDLFNDPFLGKAGGLVGNSNSANAGNTNPANGSSYKNAYNQSGLSAPLISLPHGSQSQLSSIVPNNELLKTKSPVLSSHIASKSFSEPDRSVSYPSAYSRSPSPEGTTSKEELSFAERYPSIESLGQNMNPPSIPSKILSPSSGNIPSPSLSLLYKMNPPIPPMQPAQPLSQPTYLKEPSFQDQTAPALPPRLIPTLPISVSSLSIGNKNSAPALPPKPSPSSSPPLPAKPTKIEIIRGQHPFLLPSTPIGHKFGISGLRNLGNTCFMNSILQCLSATYPFSRYFMDGSYRRHSSKNNPLSSQGRVTEGFANVVRNLWLAEESAVVPTQFKNILGGLHPNFAGNEQQDSQEFLSFLLDQLHEDLNVAQRPFPPNGPDLDSENYSEQEFMMIEWEKYRARNWSIIVDMFQGVLRSVLQCLTCGKTSTTYNMFMYLTLPIPSRNKQGVKNGPVTMFECLESFLAPEKLSGDDQWKCPRCKVNRDATKRLSIVRLPTVLLIHFKRFSFQGPFRDKLETAIYYPVKKLDLSKYSQCIGDSYSLCAVSNHFGGLNGGHYTAQVRHVHNEQWFTLDDSRVSEASENSVQSSAAYILFYICNQNKMGDWWNGTPS